MEVISRVSLRLLKKKCAVSELFLTHRKHLANALLFVLSPILFLSFYSNPVAAVAEKSTLTLSVTNNDLLIMMYPTSSGTFDKSSNTTINVKTNNFTGYTLKIASETSTSLLNNNEDAIESITQSIDELTFSSSSVYNNKWGYKPSHYVSNNTVVQNSNYLPAPSTLGDTIDITSAANSVNNTYTLSFGARISYGIPADTYTGSLVITAVANTIVYNVTYDKNTSETVTSMPVPNPQALELAGGTPVADSYATLSNSVPTMTTGDIMTFAGWCDEATTLNTITRNYECAGTTYLAGADYPIDQTADGTNITLYAIWLTDPFPTVFSQMGKCIFDGAEDTNNGYISGSECTTYSEDKYIDTKVALYSATNFSKDYEVHFTVDKYVYGDQPDSQSTIFNDKLSSSVTGSPYGGKSPGVVVRKNSVNNTFEIKSTYTTTPLYGDRVVAKAQNETFEGTDVRIFRINGVIYTSINGEPLVELQDMTNPVFNQYFGLNAWFGAYPDNVNCTENCTAAKRYFEGELSNMYIKLGDFDESNLHEVVFANNDGTQDSTVYLVLDGDEITSFPEVTRGDWTFGGWWTEASGGVEKTAPFEPDSNITLYAHWYKAVSQAQILNNSINLNINDTETINITNSADLEPYEFSSNNTSVATVSSSGVITAVGNGITTITMTGEVTGTTQTITVTVGNVIQVTFDPDFGSESPFTRNIVYGASFDDTTMPTYTRAGYELEGWWTGHNGTGTKLTTSTVFNANTPTTYYANWEEVSYVCKAATVRHTETCNRTSAGCVGAGYSNGGLIEYGSLIQSGATALVPGNAMTCDINYDGTFDEEDERFYYYATNANNNAELIYYKNTSNAENLYDDALALLPTSSTTGWTNPGLVTFDSTLLNGDYNGKVARFMSREETVTACNNQASGFGAGGRCLYILEKSNFANTDIRDGFWVGTSAHKSRVHTSSRNITDSSTRNGVRPVIEVPLELVSLEPPFVAYQITFNPHNETSSSTYTINAGDNLSNVYPVNDPTYPNHIFQGWYTEVSGGALVTSSTQPSGNATYHAQWLGTVALAAFSSNSISVEEGSTETITVTNAAEIENYGFSSLNDSIATVDSNGVVTGVAEGNTFIRVTGASSLTFVDIPVSVSAAKTTYDITFDPHNETQASTYTINIGDTLSSIYPATDPTYTNHVFQGWYTAASGGTLVTSNTQPDGDTTYHAQWLKSVALATLSSNSISVVTGGTETITVTNSAELEDYSFSSLNPLIATVDSNGTVTGVAGGTTTIRITGTDSGDYVDVSVKVLTMVCQLATTGTLHTATNTDNIQVEYGQIANNPTPQAGDAYNCDVDDDGTYSATTERFYYLGQDNDDNAVLVAWNSYQNGDWAPGDNTASTYNYTNAVNQLPENGAGEWDNPGLIEPTTGKAARFMYYTEVVSACGGGNVTTSGALEACDYLMEHTAYDNGGRSALWLMLEGSTYRRIHAGDGNRHVASANASNTSTVRPAIVVPFSLIEKFTPLDVTHAIIANNDLTVPVGGQITISVSNAAELEPYSFSSANDLIATVDSNGVVTGVGVGTVNVIMTGSQSHQTKTLEVDVTAAAVTQHRVTFNANGGTLDNGASSTRDVNDNTAVGALPTASKANNRFFGWYTDDGTFYDEVYADQIIDDDITFYARWVGDTANFPIEFAEINECQFNGNAVISGDNCMQNKTKNFIDTGLSLFSTTNYQKDFEIGFTIVEYDPNNQTDSQATLVNSKFEDSASNYPGFVVRRNNANLQLTGRFSHGNPTDWKPAASTVKRIKIVRENQIIKYSLNDGNLVTWYNVTNNTHRFNTRVWFGAASTSDDETSQRGLKGKLTDMYVRLGVDNEYTVELNANGGTLPGNVASIYEITVGDPVGALPTPTAPNASYTFGGWYIGDTLVSDGTQYYPQSNVTLVAKWNYQASDTPVVIDVSNDATRGYKTIVSQWVQSPIDITTFNENATINNSTWGDTSELSEAAYWTTLKNNFQNYGCSVPSYSDAVTTEPNPTVWTSGSVNCSKPDVYDTLIGAPLNVYLYNNQTLGAQVTYADASDGVLRNLIPGNTYKWVKDGDTSIYGYVTVESNGSSTGTRWVDAGKIRNVRDLGGLPADTDGDGTVDATVNYGRLFRGERLWDSPTTALTKFGINKEYDVGDPAEYSNDTQLPDYQFDKVIHYNFDYNSGDENRPTSNYMMAWTAVTDIMSDIVDTNNPKNIYFHCRVGADRTGTVAYLLEGLLGVPDEERYEEYSLTHLSGLFDRARYYKLKSSTNNLKFVFMMGYVKTTADILAWYNHNPDADSNLISAFRSAMTTPIASQSPSPAPAQQNNSNNLNNLNSVNSLSQNDNLNNSAVANYGSMEDNTGSINSFESSSEPLGVSSSSGDGGQIATALAATAAVTAVSGAALLAKSKQMDYDDD